MGEEPIEVMELEDRVVPDNSFDEAYAVYFRLSYEPDMKWQEMFERLMREEVHPRITSFVGPRLRVVISRRTHLESLIRQIKDVVRRTNLRAGLAE